MSTGAANPRDLLYHPAHDWVRIDDTTATFGVTWFAQSQLGEIVYWDPPQVGSRVVKDEPYSELESVKAVSDVLAPLSGVVLECNERVAAELTLINEDNMRLSIGSAPTHAYDGSGEIWRRCGPPTS